ncbi:MAG: hypothetical protein H7338_24545 [Candidatus Sericytochromatia bacterium]|nr:hypothetical protein [Candidatus Sericytochromatia bacterium]
MRNTWTIPDLKRLISVYDRHIAKVAARRLRAANEVARMEEWQPSTPAAAWVPDRVPAKLP